MASSRSGTNGYLINEKLEYKCYTKGELEWNMSFSHYKLSKYIWNSKKERNPKLVF